MKKNKTEEELEEITPIEEDINEKKEEDTPIEEEINKTKEEQVDEVTLKKKKKKKIIIIISIIVALLLIAGISIFLLTKNKKDNKNEEIKKDQITITFDTNGGNKIEPLKVEKNARVNYPIPEKENHLFLGWYNVEEKVLRTTTFDSDITLTAHWEELNSDTKTMTISYDTGKYDKLNDETVICGLPLDLPDIRGDGYYLTKWVDDNETEVIRGSIMPCKDITLHGKFEEYAQYKEIKCPDGYYVRYNDEYEGKCVKSTSTIADCKNGTVSKYGNCYDYNDTIKNEKKCGNWTLIRKEDGSLVTYTNEGELFDDKYCGFYVWEGYTEETCKSKYEDEPVWANGKCYSVVEEVSYSINCPENYNYDMTNHTCIRVHEEYLKCPEGYIMDPDGYHSCISVTDPIE